MSRVTYQGMLDGRGDDGVYVRLGAGTIRTRRKDADVRMKVTVSAPQRRWLEEVEAVTGGNVDADAVVRALLDLGMELDVDWPLIARGKMLRAAVRDAVMVRRGARRPG